MQFRFWPFRKAEPSPALNLFSGGWDFVDNGVVLAHLIQKIPNVFRVEPTAGHEADLEDTLFRPPGSSPDNERFCYRSRSDPSVVLHDSEVIVYWSHSKYEVSFKIYH